MVAHPAISTSVHHDISHFLPGLRGDPRRAPGQDPDLAVAELTEALRLALQRLQEAEAEAQVAAACVAARDADAAIEKARRATD